MNFIVTILYLKGNPPYQQNGNDFARCWLNGDCYSKIMIKRGGLWSFDGGPYPRTDVGSRSGLRIGIPRGPGWRMSNGCGSHLQSKADPLSGPLWSPSSGWMGLHNATCLMSGNSEAVLKNNLQYCREWPVIGAVDKVLHERSLSISFIFYLTHLIPVLVIEKIYKLLK